MTLSAEEQDFVERTGLVFERQGLPRTAGRILGYLLLADPPYQSSRDLVEALHVSKAAISTQTRLLIGAGTIERVGVPGTRGDHFQLTPRGWGELLRQHIHKMTEVRQLTERGLALAETRDPTVHERIKAMHDFYAFMERELPDLLARWHEQSGLQP